MQKIMFNDKYNLTELVLEEEKQAMEALRDKIEGLKDELKNMCNGTK